MKLKKQSSKQSSLINTIKKTKCKFFDHLLIREEGQSHGTAKPLRSPARPRLCIGLEAYIIAELSTKDPLLMNRSQIALIVNTDFTDTSAVFQLQPQLQPL